MRPRTSGFLLLLIAGTFLSLIHGQDSPLKSIAPIVIPTEPAPPAAIPAIRSTALPPSVPAAPVAAPQAEPVPLSPLHQQMSLSAQRGADWLAGMNRVNGRFLYGWVTSLNVPLEGDHYLHQAGATFTLAQATSFIKEAKKREGYEVLVLQALLNLFAETTTDARDPQVRYTALPSIVINRLGAAGLLVLAVHELPNPRKDLLDMSEQLCNFIRSQARADGSLATSEPGLDGKPGAEDPEAIQSYPGIALYALLRSHKRQPAAWKLDVVRKAVAYYHAWWRKNRSMAFVAWQSAAYAEAYQLTREKVFADCVFEMNDWICDLQYERIDPRQQQWYGGFQSFSDGKPVQTPPGISSACHGEGLAHACRTAREAADDPRYRRYTATLERCLQFVVTLQYNESNTQHFEASYRQRLAGSFHASYQDGDLRLDYTQHALSALILYLQQVVR